VTFETLSGGDNGFFIAPFSLLEIEEVVRDSDGGKARGPMGTILLSLRNFGT